MNEQLRGWTTGHELAKTGVLHKLHALKLIIAQLGEGDVLEFGVGSGFSLGNLAEYALSLGINNKFFGFDSFSGLPRREGCWDVGWFSFPRPGVEKALEGLTNVTLVPGVFEDVLTPELRESLGLSRAAFIHVDSDLYSSAVTVLEWTRPLMFPGTFIVFDEWGGGEHEAWAEFAERTGIEVEGIREVAGEQKAFKVLKILD